MNTVPSSRRRVNPSASSAQDERARPLGIITSIVSAQDVDIRRQDAVNRRFSLQNTARLLLPDHRVSSCLRVPLLNLVDVLHHPEHQTASFGGLSVCGSVHVCPVCAAKIGQRRSAEVTGAAQEWLRRGNSVLMVTFTLQHRLSDSLADVAGAMNQAYRLMRGCRAWLRFVERFGLVGSISAREYTIGASGWHPHLHALMFVNRASRGGVLAVQEYLSEAWSNAVAKEGRYAHPDIGVNVQLANDDGLAEYVAKVGKTWTVGDELAKANNKLGRRVSLTPPQLLHLFSLGDEVAGARFVEYADWTFRKNQLVWTPGLRELLRLEEEKTDEEVAEELTADAELLASLHRAQWLHVLAHDARAELLIAACSGDVEQVAAVLAALGLELDRELLLQRSLHYQTIP